MDDGATTLPYLTHDIPGVGGRIRATPADFHVEEIPLYEASGEGTHTYFCLEKQGLSTLQALREVARSLNVHERQIGYAGLKDADAVTRQVMSIEHVEPAVIESLTWPRMRVYWTKRHRNKIKLGHLWGNRFTLKVRDTDEARLDDVRSILAILQRRGVPNYFGPQRFGRRGDNWRVGRAILKQNWSEAAGLLLGGPRPEEGADVRRAREAYDQSDFETALQAWPPAFRVERRACRALLQTKSSHKRALLSVDLNLRRLYVSAFQSYLFNAVVASRCEQLDTLMAGDLAWRHANGAVFAVEDAPKEQPRCDAFEISPSGPLFGYRMTEAAGRPGETESAVLAETGLAREDFRSPGAHRVKGARRPLRFQPTDVSVESGADDLSRFVALRFALRAGCYATAVLREVCKSPEFDMPSAGGGSE